MEVTIIGIAILISKVATTYAVSLGVVSGMQYYHDFKMIKKTKERGGGKSGQSNYDSKISKLRREVSEPE